jgi:hypothetical protein
MAIIIIVIVLANLAAAHWPYSRPSFQAEGAFRELITEQPEVFIDRRAE